MFVAPAYPPALKRLNAALERFDPLGTFIRYLGPVPYNDLPSRYSDADVCLYASSCENMPNILMESMASGLPIACSNRGPMPEVSHKQFASWGTERVRAPGRTTQVIYDVKSVLPNALGDGRL